MKRKMNFTKVVFEVYDFNAHELNTITRQFCGIVSLSRAQRIMADDLVKAMPETKFSLNVKDITSYRKEVNIPDDFIISYAGGDTDEN